MKYQGLAIGGPDDGKQLVHYETILKRLPAGYMESHTLRSLAEPDMTQDDVVVYYFTSMALLGRDPFDSSVEVTYGFWLIKGATIEDAMIALTTRYAEPQRHKSLIERTLRYLRTFGRSASLDSPEASNEYTKLTQELYEEISNAD